MISKLYFDQAATSLPKPDETARACYEAVLNWGNGGRGGHTASLDGMRGAYSVREKLASMFGLSAPERVCFTGNITDSLNIALQGMLRAGDHVITTAMEHNSVLRPLYLMESRGVELTILPADDRGRVRWDLLESSIRPNTKLLVCQHGSNVTGNLNDLSFLGGVCREKGISFVVDAAQTAGLYPIDMASMGISVLCLTGHKTLMGPQGIGALLVSPDTEISPFRVGGSGVHSQSRTQPAEMPTRLEAGTLNGPGIAGLGAALSWLEQHEPEKLRVKEESLAFMFYEAVRVLPGIRVYGDFTESHRCPIVSLNIGSWDSSIVSDELEQRFGILTRSGIHCAPLAHDSLGTSEQGTVRFSFSHMNTEEEVRRGIEAIRILVSEE